MQAGFLGFITVTIGMIYGKHKNICYNSVLQYQVIQLKTNWQWVERSQPIREQDFDMFS